MKRFLLATFAAFAIVSPTFASDVSEGGNGEGVTQTIQEQIELLGLAGQFEIRTRPSTGEIVADGGVEMAGLNTGLNGGE
jgi:opacity protein-like surface antigen